jgi:hypothetical protein
MPKLVVGMPKRILDMPIPGMTQVFWCGNDADTVRVLLGLLCCIQHGRSASGNDHILLGLTIGSKSGELPLGMPEPASGMVFGATVTGMSIGGSGTLVDPVGTVLTG